MSTKLFYYSDFAGHAGWYPDRNTFRKAFPESKIHLRTAHVGIDAPKGYYKPEGELAFAPAVKLPNPDWQIAIIHKRPNESMGQI